MLPAADRLMRSPGYWIVLHPSPDSLILDEHGIENLNRVIRDEDELTTDLGLSDPCPASEILDDLRELMAWFRERKLYRADGSPVTPAFYEEMDARMNLEKPFRRVFPCGTALSCTMRTSGYSPPVKPSMRNPLM